MGGAVNVNAGAGNDQLHISDLSVSGSASTAGSVAINMGAGNDRLDLSNLSVGASSTAGGTINILGGTGNDNLNLSGLNATGGAGLATLSSININAGAGNDRVSLSESAADQLFADLGVGNDVLNASGALAFTNAIQINGNVGKDKLTGNAAVSAAGNAVAQLLGLESIL